MMIATMFFYLGMKVNDIRIKGRIQKKARPFIETSFFVGDALNHIFQLNVLDPEHVMVILETIYE